MFIDTILYNLFTTDFISSISQERVQKPGYKDLWADLTRKFSQEIGKDKVQTINELEIPLASTSKIN